MDTQTRSLGQPFRRSKGCDAGIARRSGCKGTANHIVKEKDARHSLGENFGWLLRPSPLTRQSGSRGHGFSISNVLQVLLLSILAFAGTSSGAFISTFDDCLSPNTINSNLLKFTPLWVWASFNTSAPSHGLNVTIYGDVSGIATQQPIPLPDDPQWNNTNDTVGKIVDVSKSTNLATTLETQFNVLDYTPYDAPLARFCNTTLPQTKCPISPVFNPNARENPDQLPGFSVAHDLYSSYAFTTFSTNFKIKSGDANAAILACINAEITPELGNTLSNVLTYIPLVVLIFVAIATACAAIFSPWGSTDIFRFTSNYGRDADLLRLVTPGFGDCLQYIQFIVLAGSLSLNYPGFYQPAVSQVSWSALMFNESFVSHGNGTQSLVDGIYKVNGSYGLDRMSQLVGMTHDEDIWAGMVVWLLVIIAAVVVLIQLGFVGRWVYRFVSNTQNEDLRAKNAPFSIGNAIRIVFNYFLLPIVALSMYQLVVAHHSPTVTVALAAITIVALVLFAAWLLWFIASTRPRSYLFDDLPTVLLYGPLYNTYSDDAATFALIPVMLTFVRGITIGAVQPSGIAQLVLLAICEVITILTLNAFRPFHSPTSMNAFHTFFAAARLLSVLLSVAFLTSLNVRAAVRGWIGYVILLLHAIVLVFGFFLNACQTLIEVVARLAGAGGEEGVDGGAARGGLVKVFGMRQLSRRNPRRRGQVRHSIASDAAILGPDGDQKSFQMSGGRSRSLSASSAILLNKQNPSDPRQSMGLDSVSASGAALHRVDSESAPYTPSTGGTTSAFSYLAGASQAAGQGGSAGAGIVNLKNAEAADPYYRPPRPRRPTVDAYTPGAPSRGSWTNGDLANRRWSQHDPPNDGSPNYMEGPSISGRGTPVPAHLGTARERSDSNADDPRRSKTDYATREVDFYYGVRGPALSNLPTRRLKTGPGDPTGPVSSATGWLKSLFGGKTKDSGKGFEVVRSSRAPPARRTPSGALVLEDEASYTDAPGPAVERSRDLALSDEGDAVGGGTRHLPMEDQRSPLASDEESDDKTISEDEFSLGNRESQVSPFPPALPTIETGGGIELPSRMHSRTSSAPMGESSRRAPPTVPRKSSRRHSQHSDIRGGTNEGVQLSTILQPSQSTTQDIGRLNNSGQGSQHRRQPVDGTVNRLPFETHLSPIQDGRRSADAGSSANSSLLIPTNEDEDLQGAATQTRNRPSALGFLAPDTRQDRPQSMGFVQQHRTSDNIHTASPDDPAHQGSSAELVDEPSR